MTYWTCNIVLIMITILSHTSYAIPTLRDLRLTLEDVSSSYNAFEPEGLGTYAFGYNIDDPGTENQQFRDEERKSDGSVTGRYGWVAADGTVYIVSYVADSRGYRANVENLQVYKLRRTHHHKTSEIQ